MLRVFTTPQTDVYYLTETFLDSLHDFTLRNKEWLTPFEPSRTPDYYQLKNTHQRILTAMKAHENRAGVSMVFTLKNDNKIIGCVNFSNFVFGVFQACHLGYSVDQDYQSKGLMTEVLQIALPYIHQQYGLHRVMANYLPDNGASGRVLEKLGFEKEGYAKSYLKINGEWRDHILTAYVFPE